MNLLQGLKNKLQVLTLKKDLKAAKQEADQSAWQERGRRGIDFISQHGKFVGTSGERASVLKFALAGIREAGAAPRLEPTAGLNDPNKDSWLRVKKGEELSGFNGGHDSYACIRAAYAELAAAIEAKGGKPDPAPSAPNPPPAPAASKPVSPPITPKSPTTTSMTSPSITAPRPGPLAQTPVTELAKTLSSVFKNDAGKAAAKAELETRPGYFVIESTPFAAQWRYFGMTTAERDAWAANGGRIGVRNPTKAELAGTSDAYRFGVGTDEEPTIKPTGSPHDFIYPLATAKRRTLEQFLSLSRADVKVICAECSVPRGAALRRELYDATHPDGTIFWRTESERNLVTGFKATYSQGFQHISSLGPDKLDNEAPPVLSGQMTAEELLALPADSAKGLVDQNFRPGGRSIRREIKIAYMRATGAQKVAMMARFEAVLKRHIHERI